MCIGTPIKSKTVVMACVVIRPILETHMHFILVHVDMSGKMAINRAIIPQAAYVDNAGISSVILR
jgi:hypothetical protein